MWWSKCPSLTFPVIAAATNGFGERRTYQGLARTARAHIGIRRELSLKELIRNECDKRKACPADGEDEC
jgi:hypothetical protein